MKKFALTVFILTASLCIQAQNLFVATYNLRYDNEDDRQEGNGWTKRCQVICDFLNFEQPDIFGTQEGLKHQLEDLKRGLDQYDYIGIGREDGKEQGEHSAIFYKKDKLKCFDKGNFWLNETPGRSLFSVGMPHVFGFVLGESLETGRQILPSISLIFTWIMWVLLHGVRLQNW